jgi:hypothetical protein
MKIHKYNYDHIDSSKNKLCDISKNDAMTLKDDNVNTKNSQVRVKLIWETEKQLRQGS